MTSQLWPRFRRHNPWIKLSPWKVILIWSFFTFCQISLSHKIRIYQEFSLTFTVPRNLDLPWIVKNHLAAKSGCALNCPPYANPGSPRIYFDFLLTAKSRSALDCEESPCRKIWMCLELPTLRKSRFTKNLL